jgi:hypothetical protein
VHLKHRLRYVETDCCHRLHDWLLRIVGASTAPTSMALMCRWRSRPQHHKQTLPVATTASKQPRRPLIGSELGPLLSAQKKRSRPSPKARQLNCESHAVWRRRVKRRRDRPGKRTTKDASHGQVATFKGLMSARLETVLPYAIH